MYRRKKDLLRFVRSGQPMTVRQQVYLAAQLSVPSIFAQISSVIMQYIDASMVGSLGANASASIGLVSTTTWLFMGLCTSVAAGFAVQVAHLLGAKDEKGARVVLRQALVLSLLFGLLLAAIGCGISGYLPRWLGGDEAIRHDATGYFMIYALSLPALQLNMLAGSMLRCSGNVYVPSVLNMLMCVMDVIFNLFLIFPSQTYEIAGFSFYLPGAGLGVEGAALGTALALLVTALLMLYFLCFRSPELGLRHRREKLFFTGDCLRRAFRIGLPMGCERIIMCGAQILSTVIVAPLGIYAIAANAFAITAESLCYMPGYGIADAATTLVGQSLGAKRHDLARSFARITVIMGMAVMTVMGTIMYLAAPLMIGVMTPGSRSRFVGRFHFTYRSVCRTDVRCRHCGLRRVYRSRRYIGSGNDEFREYLGRSSYAGRFIGTFYGTARRVDCDVHRTLFPGYDIPRPYEMGKMDQATVNRYFGLVKTEFVYNTSHIYVLFLHR